MIQKKQKNFCFLFKALKKFSKVKREAAAQRRPAQSKRKNSVFSAKRQAVWFEML